MRSVRACTFVLPVVVMAVCLALLASGAASGAESTGPKALWDAYPLKQKPSGGAAVSRDFPRTVAQLETAAGGFAPVVVVLLAAAMLGIGVVVGRGWSHAAPAAAAPGTLRPARARPWDTLGELFDGDPWPGDAEAYWRCEIVWASGYRMSRFRAVARAPGRRRKQVVASTAAYGWMWRADPDAERAKYRVPVQALASKLREAGWESTDPGDHWWNARFVWTRPGPPPRGGLDER